MTLTVVVISGLTTWAYFQLSAPTEQKFSENSSNFKPLKGDQETKTVQHFANYLKRNPSFVTNQNEQLNSDSTVSSPITSEPQISENEMLKLSQHILSLQNSSEEELVSQKLNEVTSKQKIMTFLKLWGNDAVALGLSETEKDQAFSILKDQLKTDSQFLHDMIDAAQLTSNDPNLIANHLMFIRETAPYLEPESSDAPKLLSLLEAQHLPSIDFTVQAIAHKFPDFEKKSPATLPMRSVASEQEQDH